MIIPRVWAGFTAEPAKLRRNFVVLRGNSGKCVYRNRSCGILFHKKFLGVKKGETKMSRYVNRIATTRSKEEIDALLVPILQREGFTYVKYEGEDVWKKGVGLMTAPQFFKYEYLGDSVGVQAWLKFAILPGVYAGEMGLKGFWGIAIKKMLQARVNEMEYAIANANPQPQVSANV